MTLSALVAALQRSTDSDAADADGSSDGDAAGRGGVDRRVDHRFVYAGGIPLSDVGVWALGVCQQQLRDDVRVCGGVQCQTEWMPCRDGGILRKVAAIRLVIV